MKELEELTADIREKLPRLKELETGCIFIYPTSNKNHYKVTQSSDDMISFRKLNEFSNPRVEYKSVIVNKYSVIGKNPMLNDVLEWLNKTKEYTKSPNAFAFDCHGNLFRINPATDELWDYGPKWDLSKPYLKDQSPELIKFLHGLINHKKTKQ